MSRKTSDRQLQVVISKSRRALSIPSIFLLGCCAACGSTDATVQSASSGAGGMPGAVGGAVNTAGAANNAGAAGLISSGQAGGSESGGGGEQAGAVGSAGSSAGTAGSVGNGGASGAGAGNGGASGGEVSSVGDGDFMVGPTYTKSPDLTNKGAPAGKSFHFSLSSANSQIFKGTDSTLAAANQHSFTRGIDVYIPAKYKDGQAAPFMVIQDGPGQLGNIKLALDNLTQSTDPARRLPAFIAIAVANGGGDSIGSERGLEYDTMSDRYARFIQTEVLPAVLADPGIKAAYPGLALTGNPDGRATIGCSSGAAAALTMGCSTRSGSGASSLTREHSSRSRTQPLPRRRSSRTARGTTTPTSS